MAFNYLYIPLRIEGNFLNSARQVSSPLADFSKLPYNYGSSDKNFSQPFVADGIVHEPFADDNLLLEKGLHLHFIIPHYLGQHVPQKSGLTMAGNLPPAPNRWLVTKKTNGAIIKQWIIESDYVHNETYIPEEAQCVIPFNTGQPFRFMGRKTLLSDTRTPGNTFKSLSGKPLTVLGYGDINFSSFYPNCLGVFGFYDADAELNSNSIYSVLGWNDDVNDDLLNSLVEQLVTSNPSITNDAINKQLLDLFKIQIDLDNVSLGSGTALRSIFYGELNADNTNPNGSNLGPIEIAIGNTGTEALSALLADNYSTNSDQKKNIEEQLESVLMNAQLEHLLTDFGPKFLEARHEKGFRAIHSGKIWKLTFDNTESNSNTDELFATSEMPNDLAHLLDDLNIAQHNYDQAINNIVDLKEQLYADWCKYMHLRYPPLGSRGAFIDADHVMYYLQNYSMEELNGIITATGTVIYGDESKAFCPTPKNIGANDLANTLNSKWAAINSLLTSENTTRISSKQKPIQLVLSVAPSYWTANAPVVLISGIDNGSMDDYDGKATITQAQFYNSNQVLNEQGISSNNTNDILNLLSGKNSAKLSEQKTNPFILDWEVDLILAKMHDSNKAIKPSAIQDSFCVDQLGPDLQKTSDVLGIPSVFSGSAFLSSHANVSILKQIENFFKTHISKKGISYTSNNNLSNFLNASDWDSALSVFNTQTVIINTKDFNTNPYYTIWFTYKNLLTKNILSQTLSGFNDACLMRKKVTQLPVHEPIGFDYAKTFTSSVGKLVEEHKTSSPIVAFDFNPIRSGNFKVNRLSLIDNFGIVIPIPRNTINPVVSNSLDDGSGNAFLMPRFSQPARLNFRWLSSSGEMEMNSHPASSPVVGWLLPNYLDNTIAVFDADGNALGYLDENGTWALPPWVDGTASIQTNISNTYLQNVILQLCSSNNFFDDFVSATQEALNNIAPPDAHLYNTKATLMGRPMAVVRSQLSFEVKGLPAIDQSWSSMIIDLNNCDGKTWNYANRNNANWDSIKLPIRLGEHMQLNDGLIGYWVENDNGQLMNKFIAPETQSATVSPSDTNMDAYTGKNYQTQWLALKDEPLTVTMLIDPTAKIHATSGVLPVKRITLPPEQYVHAMSKMALWFNTSYLIQPAELSGINIALDLPPVAGYKWSWWDPFFNNLDIIKDNKQHTNTSSQAQDGWLRLTPDTNSTNTPTN
jgi:hypothetical protein